MNYNIKTLEIEYKPQNKEIFYNGILIKSSGEGNFGSIKFDLPDFGDYCSITESKKADVFTLFARIDGKYYKSFGKDDLFSDDAVKFSNFREVEKNASGRWEFVSK